MPKPRLILPALIAFALTTGACASKPASAPLPRLSIPEAATTPCALPVLPEAPTQGDLDAAYLARGQAVAVCEGRRRLAIDTLLAEREMIDRATQPPAPGWRHLWSR